MLNETEIKIIEIMDNLLNPLLEPQEVTGKMKFLRFARFAPMIKKVIKILFYLYLFLLPVQTRFIYAPAAIKGQFWEYGSRFLYLTEFILFFVILFYLIGSAYYIIKADLNKKVKPKSIFSENKAILLAVLFLLWSLASLLWAHNRSIAWYRWTILLQGIIVFLFIAKQIVETRTAFISFFSGALCQSLLGIYQFMAQRITANKWFGIAEHFPANIGTSVVETSLDRWLRAYGSLPHPNLYAGYLAIALILGIIIPPFIINKYSPPNSLEEAVKKELKKFIYYLFIFLLGAGIVIAFSRAAWLGIILGILIAVFAIWKKRGFFPANLAERFNIPLIGFLILFSLIIFFLREPILTRLNGSSRLERISNAEHVASYQKGLSAVKKNLLMGGGIGNYTMVSYLKNPGLSVWDYQPSHNLFILIWSELGIIGLIIFISLLIFAAEKILKTNSIYLSLFIIIVILGFFDHYFWTSYTGVILFWLALGFIIGAIGSSRAMDTY